MTSLPVCSHPASNGLLFWALAYKASDLLFEMMRVGVLGKLETGSRLEALSRDFQLDAVALQAAMVLLRKAGVVAQDGDVLRLTTGAIDLLPWLKVESVLRRWHEEHRSLTRAFSGDASGDPLDHIDDPEFFTAYADAMSRQNRVLALYILKICCPRPGARLLDLGAADGAVTIELLARIADASALLVDRAALQESAHRRIARSGLGEHVRFVACDLRQRDGLPQVLAEADLTLMLNIAHLLPGPALDGMLNALADGLRPGAALVVYDQFADSPCESVGVSDLLLVDWLMCGTSFADSAETFAGRLEKRCFHEVQVRLFPRLPGAFVTALR